MSRPRRLELAIVVSILTACGLSRDIEKTLVASPPNQNGWTQTFGSIGADTLDAMGIDLEGAIHVAGSFGADLQIGTATLTYSGTHPMYLCKLTSSGTQSWANAYSGSIFPRGLAVAPDGSSIVVGHFIGQLVAGAMTLTSVGGADAFAMKVSPQGDLLWATSFGGPGYDSASQTVLDAMGNVFVAGEYSSGAQIAGTVLPSASQTNVFLVRLSGQDGTPSASQVVTGATAMTARGAALDPAGYAAVAGTFAGTPQAGQMTLKNQGNTDAFVLRYTPNLQ